ncbi:MAG: hypothetical protein ACJAYE_001170 [Candidatus Azotimanducaceae bacterium]|jgi:hypothetical protein
MKIVMTILAFVIDFMSVVAGGVKVMLVPEEA